MRGKTVDRLALHGELWSRRDRVGRVEIYQKRLAEELGITQATMSLIIKDFSQEGRVNKVGAKKGNIGIYIIRDPNFFDHLFDPLPIADTQIMRCARCGELENVGKHVLDIP